MCSPILQKKIIKIPILTNVPAGPGILTNIRAGLGGPGRSGSRVAGR